MAAQWSRTTEGLEISQTGSLLTKLFGLPFLGAGLYLLWQFVTGLAGFFVPSLGQLTIAGFIMLPVFALLVGTPGWLLVVTRKRTLVEAATRRVLEVFDHLVYKHRKEKAIPRGARVRLRLEKSQSTGDKGGRTVVLLLVDIVGENAEIPLAVFGDDEVEPARALAMEAAGLLGISIADEIEKGAVDPSADDDEEEDEPASA
jgi:hypothetical protein